MGIVKELIEILPNEVCDNNQGRRRMGSGENTEQTAGKGQKQILSMMERVYSRIWYLERKKECKRIQKKRSKNSRKNIGKI